MVGPAAPYPPCHRGIFSARFGVSDNGVDSIDEIGRLRLDFGLSHVAFFACIDSASD
jgi:hypothetical protein